MRIARDDPSLVAEWWFTVDRLLLSIVMALFSAGVVLTFAASPAIAIRKSLPPLHFVERHAVLAVVSVASAALAIRSVRAGTGTDAAPASAPPAVVG